MILVWAKLIHIAAVSVWAGGLLVLPLLLAAGERGRAPLRDFYIGWLTPAAFAATLSGIVLVTDGGRQSLWFDAKLTLVLLLALVHVLVARRIVARLSPAPRLLLRSMAATAVATSLAMVWVAVAKPGAALAGACGPVAGSILTLTPDGEILRHCPSPP